MIEPHVVVLISAVAVLVTVLFLLWIRRIDKAIRRTRMDRRKWTDEEIEKLAGRKYTALEINRIGTPYDRSSQHGNSQLDQGSPRKQ
jgi:hypothetical protein